MADEQKNGAIDEQDAIDLHYETMELKVGPSHPATHGTVRIQLKLDAEFPRDVFRESNRIRGQCSARPRKSRMHRRPWARKRSTPVLAQSVRLPNHFGTSSWGLGRSVMPRSRLISDHSARSAGTGRLSPK